MIRKLVIVAAAVVVAYFAYVRSNGPVRPSGAERTSLAASQQSAVDAIAQAFAQRRSNVVVQGAGNVSRVLPDDDGGSRHQRFILTLPSGHTVLIAHNIDLAPRIDGLRSGDRVEFSGEYEWNPQGGVVHWTHRDPQGRHAAGWLRRGGRTYQ